MQKRLIFLSMYAAIGGLLYVPFIKAAGGEFNEATWIIFPSVSVASVLLFSWLGILLMGKTDLQMPVLNAWESGNPLTGRDFKVLVAPLLLGLAFGVLLVIGNQFVDIPENPGGIWVRILTTPWAGLVTEIVSHLLVMTLIYMLVKNKWFAIILSSLVFLVVFHLNGLEGDITLTIYLATGNFAGATLTGWIYSKYGFESAVVAHSAMHLVLLAVN